MPPATHAPAAAPARPSGQARAWRTDLEGLRVLAILLVAVYHVWFHRVSGGVDVFLLLSGFFVGGSLWRNFAADSPPRAGAYFMRHLRRLLPAAAVVAAGTALGIWLLVPATRWEDASRQLLASIGFHENWQLIANGSQYGAADAAQSPWQHFWSLSVQGQMFLAVPLLLLLGHLVARRTGHHAAVATSVLATAFAASVFYAFWSAATRQEIAYFDTFARAWEFLAGALLAVLLAHWTPRWRGWALAGWAGVILLILTGVLVNGAHTFPGPAALLPTGAAALVILGGASGRSSLDRVIGARWLASLGRYAYAFYLWHWPLLVFTQATRDQIDALTGAGILAASAALAYATYHGVESPMRGQRSPRRLIASAIAWVLGCAAVVAAAAWLVVVDRTQGATDLAIGGDPALLEDYPGAMVSPTIAYAVSTSRRDPLITATAIGEDLPTVVADHCITGWGSAELASCTYGDPAGEKTIVLFGASHAEQWFPAVEALAQSAGWRLVPLLKPGCPVNAAESADVTDDCRDWLDRAFNRISALQPDYVITTSTRTSPEGDESVPDSYVEAFDRLSAYTTVVGIRSAPMFASSVPELWLADPDWSTPLPASFVEQDPLSTVALDNVVTIDMNDLVCPEQVCRAEVGNRLVYRDDQHLAASYVETMAGDLNARFTAAVQKVP